MSLISRVNLEAFFWMIQVGIEDGVKKLLDYYPNWINLTTKWVEDSEVMPIHLAAASGHQSIVELILKLNPSMLDIPNKHGSTPLHWAARFGHRSMVKFLIRTGSNAIDSVNNSGLLPIHYAAKWGHVSVAKILLQLNPSSIDLGMLTPFHLAAMECHDSMIKFLFYNGSKSLNLPTVNGNTPLHLAVWKGHYSTIKLLLQLGATSMNSTFMSGSITPIEIADQGGHESISRMLVACSSSSEWKERQSLTEEDIIEIRFDVYFSSSLTSLLIERCSK